MTAPLSPLAFDTLANLLKTKSGLIIGTDKHYLLDLERAGVPTVPTLWVEPGTAAVDVRSLTEAAECLGASWPTILFKVIFPNIRSGILSGAFLTFAVVIGEFTLASLLDRPAFGPYLQLIGANRAYEPSALAIIAFAITWASMGLIQVFGSARGSARALAGQKP